MTKLIQNVKVLRNKKLNSSYFVLELLAPEKLPKILPGQFVQVLIDNSKNTFLRRPFSVHNIDYNKNTFKLLIQKVGNGTKVLSYLEKGNLINIIYPLGNNFSMPFDNNVLLVGGGCGIAPLLFLAKYLFENNIIPTILIGGKGRKDIVELEEYGKYGHVFVITEDGTIGVKGLITHHPLLSDINKNKDKSKANFSKIYTCGPELMMREIARISKENNIDCEASLENMMACGIGACLCCVVKTIRGNERVCTEGPIFNTKDLVQWDK